MNAAVLAPPAIAASGELDSIEQPFDVPDTPTLFEDPDEPSDLDFDGLETLPDEEAWDVFLPDDDEYDLDPAPSDFWGSTRDDEWDDVPE